MKRKRFSVEQIVGILKQAEVGVPVAEVIRRAGIADATDRKILRGGPRRDGFRLFLRAHPGREKSIRTRLW